jgi:methylase of polypeptide subunit release factors
MTFSQGLREQVLYAQGNEILTVLGRDLSERGEKVYSYPKDAFVEVATFRNPVLVTDPFRIARLPFNLRLTVERLVNVDDRITEYDGVSEVHSASKYPSVWSPSIDTLFFVDTLRRLKKLETDAKRVVDATAASGFIGKYVASKCDSVQQLDFVDINPYAVQCQYDNTRDLQARKPKLEISFHTHDCVKMRRKHYDMVLVSPPYIPRPLSLTGPANPYSRYGHFEGVGLIRYLIENGKKYLTKNGKMFMIVSSLCSSVVSEAIKNAKGLDNAAVLDKKHIPLKVLSILNNEEWMRYLLKRGLKREAKGYKFWHDTIIMEFSYR